MQRSLSRQCCASLLQLSSAPRSADGDKYGPQRRHHASWHSAHRSVFLSTFPRSPVSSCYSWRSASRAPQYGYLGDVLRSSRQIVGRVERQRKGSRAQTTCLPLVCEATLGIQSREEKGPLFSAKRGTSSPAGPVATVVPGTFSETP